MVAYKDFTVTTTENKRTKKTMKGGLSTSHSSFNNKESFAISVYDYGKEKGLNHIRIDMTRENVECLISQLKEHLNTTL